MSVAYVEKGYGLILAIKQAGFNIFNNNGVFITNPANPADTTNDAAVQNIINTYDPLPYYKQQAIGRIEAKGLGKIQTIFPSLANIDTVNLVAQLYLSIVPASRAPTTQFGNAASVYNAAQSAITNINAATTQPGVDSAEAGVVWPF
jgi:hypothetical protein